MKIEKLILLFFCILCLCIHNTYSKQTNDSISYYIDKVENPKGINSLIEAYNYLQNDKSNSLQTNQLIRAAYDLIFISRIEFDLDDLYYSEKSAIEGIKLLDSLSKNKSTIPYRIALLNNLGKIKRVSQDYDKSLIYYQEMLNLSSSNNEKGVAHNNIGVVYLYNEEYELAIEQFQKGYVFNSLTEYDDEKIRSLDNLGFTQSKLNIVKGLPKMLKALEVRLKNNDPGVFASYKHLIEYFNDRDNKERSLFYARKAYDFSKKFESNSMRQEALSNLIMLGESQYANEYRLVIEKLKAEKLKKTNEFAAAKYDYSKADNKRKAAELREAKEKSKRIESETKATRNLSIAISITLISLFIFYVFRVRHKRAKLQTRFDTERQFSKKLHDEVGNDIYHTMAKQQNKPNPDMELIDELDRAYQKARNLSKTNAVLFISENFDIDLKDLLRSYKTEDVNIFTRNVSEMPWENLPKIKKETIYRVLQELMTNMRKYSKASLVTVKFQKRGRKIAIEYIDDGIGCNLKKSNGLQNVENRIKDIGGTIIFESEVNKGFQVKIMI